MSEAERLEKLWASNFGSDYTARNEMVRNEFLGIADIRIDFWSKLTVNTSHPVFLRLVADLVGI